MLVPTPSERLCDREGRPYFLWDTDVTLAELRDLLHRDDVSLRLYWLGVLLRQAKPDDAIVIAGREAIVAGVPLLRGRLGRSEAFWTWLVSRWTSGL